MIEATDLPLPPESLIRRAGYTPGGDLTAEYLAGGVANQQLVLSLLPDDWSIDGRRILDFGCGAGKVLRHFAQDAERSELWGCDIDEASVAWIEQHMCPPFRVFRNGEEPPLAIADCVSCSQMRSTAAIASTSDASPRSSWPRAFEVNSMPLCPAQAGG
jgi:hypothetical protein